MGTMMGLFNRTHISLHTHPPSAQTVFETCQEDQAPNQLAKWQTIYHVMLVTLPLTRKTAEETFDHM